jgi:hypothetical protein
MRIRGSLWPCCCSMCGHHRGSPCVKNGSVVAVLWYAPRRSRNQRESKRAGPKKNAHTNSMAPLMDLVGEAAGHVLFFFLGGRVAACTFSRRENCRVYNFLAGTGFGRTVTPSRVNTRGGGRRASVKPGAGRSGRGRGRGGVGKYVVGRLDLMRLMGWCDK